MKIYIAFGGIGCRTLKNFAQKNGIETARCYYIDADPGTFGDFTERTDHTFWVRGVVSGTGALRAIGRNIIRHTMFSGGFEDLFAPVKELSGPIELVMLTTSFGGFGSAAVAEMADYLQSLFWDRLSKDGSGCTVIALNEGRWSQNFFSAQMLQMYEMNTMQLLGEMEGRAPVPQHLLSVISMNGMFLPQTRFFLIDTRCMAEEDLSAVPAMPDDRLQALDCRERYRIKPKKLSPAVFISYSSKDQAVADMLVKALAEKGIGCWIADKSIDAGSYARQIMQGLREAKIFAVLMSKNSVASPHVKNEIDRAFARLNQGMKIMPLLLDDTPLDDECEYYLCRQEMFSGQRPPLEVRIREFAEKISDTLE